MTRPHYLADEVPKMAAELVALRARVAEVERERDALRQAHWDGRAIGGFDNDGDPTPRAIVSDFAALILDDWRRTRQDADEMDDEVRGPPCECGSVHNLDEDGCCRTCGVDWNYELILWQDGYEAAGGKIASDTDSGGGLERPCPGGGPVGTGRAPPFASASTEALAQAFRLGVESASSGDEATTNIADSAHGMGQECAVNDCIRVLESSNCTSDRAAAATLREHFKFLKLAPRSERREGEPDEDYAAIAAMSDAEVDAFLRANGVDPEAAYERLRKRIKERTGHDLPCAPAAPKEEACRCESCTDLVPRLNARISGLEKAMRQALGGADDLAHEVLEAALSAPAAPKAPEPCDDCDGTGWLTFSDGTRAKCMACSGRGVTGGAA